MYAGWSSQSTSTNVHQGRVAFGCRSTCRETSWIDSPGISICYICLLQHPSQHSISATTHVASYQSRAFAARRSSENPHDPENKSPSPILQVAMNQIRSSCGLLLNAIDSGVRGLEGGRVRWRSPEYPSSHVCA